MSKRKAEQLEHEALKKSKEEKATSAEIDAELTPFQAALWAIAKKPLDDCIARKPIRTPELKTVKEAFALLTDPADQNLALDYLLDRNKKSVHYNLTWGLMLCHLISSFDKLPEFRAQVVGILVNALKTQRTLNLNFPIRHSFVHHFTLGSWVIDFASKGMPGPLDELIRRPQLLETLDWAPAYEEYDADKRGLVTVTNRIAGEFSVLFCSDMRKYALVIPRFTLITLHNLQEALVDEIKTIAAPHTHLHRFSLYFSAEQMLQNRKQSQIGRLYKIVPLFSQLLQKNIAGYDEILTRLDFSAVRKVRDAAEKKQVDFLVSYLNLFLKVREAVESKKTDRLDRQLSVQAKTEPAAGSFLMYYAEKEQSRPLRQIFLAAVPRSAAEYDDAQSKLKDQAAAPPTHSSSTSYGRMFSSGKSPKPSSAASNSYSKGHG